MEQVIDLNALEQGQQTSVKSKTKKRKELPETMASKAFANGKAMEAAGKARQEEARPLIEADILQDAADHTAEDGYAMGALKIDVNTPRPMADEKAQAYDDARTKEVVDEKTGKTERVVVGRDYNATFPVSAQTPSVLFSLLSPELQKTFYSILQTLDRAAGGDKKAEAILERAKKEYHELMKSDKEPAQRGGVIKVTQTRTLSEGVTARKFLQEIADLEEEKRNAYLDVAGINASIKMDRKTTNDLVRNVCIL